MESQLSNTEVNLDGLLEVLGKNLYSTPAVALRELIQNASDACERHKLEAGEGKDYQITLTANPKKKQLIIEDNGSGLTRSEITEFLATIGSGYSRILRESTQTDKVIGYFGLGFLSAYVVSKKVEVITTSYQSPDQGWRFTSAKGKTYTTTKVDPIAVGTRVTLELESDFDGLSDYDLLRSLIERYCCLLPISITFAHSADRVNDLTPPWLLPVDMSPLQGRKKALAFAQAFEGNFEPLAVIQIPEDNPYDLKGVIWVQDGGTYSTSDNRNASVFIRNMFISDEEKDLLPRWAGFCGAVFESVHFKPTASRESLQKDSYYYDVIAFIRDTLTTGLRALVNDQPEAWRRILARHNEALLGAAISDDDLFAATSNSLKVPTTDGDMTIPNLLKRSASRLYLKMNNKAGHEEILFRVKDIPLIKGFRYAAAEYTHKYADFYNLVTHLIGEGQTDSRHQENHLFPSAESVPPVLKSRIEKALASEDIDIRYVNFDPKHVPLLVIADTDVARKKRMESDEADKRISMAALSLARLHSNSITKTKEKILYINVHNPLMKIVASLPDHKAGALALILNNMMAFMCLNTEDSDKGLGHVFEEFQASMITLLDNE